MKKALLSLLALACAGFAQVDTSILKAGNVWTYEYGTENLLTGQPQHGYKGTAVFRIDSVRASGRDSLVCAVSRTDSGTTTDYQGSRTAKTLTRSTSVFAFGAWLSSPPVFAIGGFFSKPFRWMVWGGAGGTGGDTLLYVESSTPINAPTNCAPWSSVYLKSVGLLQYATSWGCGMTSDKTHYRLIEYNGKPIRDSDLIPLPLTSDFAPYALGRYWEYRVVENRMESQPAPRPAVNSVDSLLWSLQVVGLRRSTDTSLILEAHVQGRKGMTPTSPRGETVDITYLDTVLFRRGFAYPIWDLNLRSEIRNVFDLHAAFHPFYPMHGADATHLPAGEVLRDTLWDGQSLKMIAKGDGKVESAAYVQGIGLVRKAYWGDYPEMLSTGYQAWLGEIRLLGTGVRTVGILPREGNGFLRGGPAAGVGIRAGTARFGGLWFGADGRRLAPLR
jgi:hypothetical protein